MLRKCLIFLALLSAGSTNTALAAPKIVSLKGQKLNSNTLTKECRQFIDILGTSGYTYGWVQNDENKFLKDSKTLDIFYYYKKDITTEPMTVIYNGGPAESSHSTYEMLKKYNGNFLFIDQRGTGCSSLFLTPKDLPDLDPMRHSYWGTLGIVEDSEIIRKKLGIKKWNIFGQSFGGAIVLRYLEQYPESIVKAISHGLGIGDPYETLNTRYLEQLRVIDSFLKKYPESKRKIVKIAQENLCTKHGNCGQTLLSMFTDYLGFPKYWPSLAEVISNTSNQYSKKNTPNSSDVYVTPPIHYLFMEFSGEFVHFANCFKVKRLSLRNFSEAHFLLSECSQYSFEGIQYNSQSKKEIEEYLRAINIFPLNKGIIKGNLEFYKKIECHIFSAEHDFYSPPLLVRKTAGNIGPRCSYINLKNRGHNPYVPEVLKLFTHEKQVADL